MKFSDRVAIRDYYDEVGDLGRYRLSRDLPGRISFEVHRRFLVDLVRPGQRVLEVGAGPGQFTTVLAELGARTLVTDFSPVQLELNRTHVGCTSAEDAVERRELLDVCDTSRYRDGEFDVVVAYGGPLFYAFEQTEDALRGLRRITGTDGVVVASVMSMLGSWRHLLCDITTVAAEIGEDANDAVLRTGDMHPTGTIPGPRGRRVLRAERARRRHPHPVRRPIARCDPMLFRRAWHASCGLDNSLDGGPTLAAKLVTASTAHDRPSRR